MLSPILFPLQRLAAGRRGVAPLLGRPAPLPQLTWYVLSGITRDSAGVILPTATVLLHRTSTRALVAETVSDAVGAYSFAVLDAGPFYVVAFDAQDTWDDITETLDNELGTLDAIAQASGVTANYLPALRVLP